MTILDRRQRKRAPRMQDAETAEALERDLLQRYRRRPTAALRNRLIERYRGIVEGMARGLVARLPRSIDVQDLVHAGVWGLVQALDNFEPERGTQFVPFMRLRVRGAMLDELRFLDHTPRWHRRRNRAFDAAVAQLRVELGREPGDAEIAAALGISETTLRTRFGRGGAMRAGRGEEGGSALDLLVDETGENPIEALHRSELLLKIEQSLQPIEWTVLRLHYLEGQSGKQIARRLRLSASRVCQIHTRVLSRLKARLSILAG